jgi:hypothetical protein
MEIFKGSSRAYFDFTDILISSSERIKIVGTDNPNKNLRAFQTKHTTPLRCYRARCRKSLWLLFHIDSEIRGLTIHPCQLEKHML